ncbi:fumD [Symbiodinium pilosum]|uniref:Carboxylic ester hydrolase n=1 Tax=Symbiodinium pilosum TaxID=2952 RepID=A0A812YB38_SYMPI|nr:fumD [Symbiodinium pilosum]
MSEGTAGDLNPGPVVHLQGQGSVEGRVQDGVARFLGIPYAVAERWKAPKSPAPWQGTLFQRRLARCPQPGRPSATSEGHIMEDDENCLQLNIWTPMSALADSESCPKLPVLVYIHGGGGKSHSAHCPRESGHHLALAQGLCCVNINYRLGIFGFLAHPELSQEDRENMALGDKAGSGNYAMLDQLCALSWVQRHIANFGGDAQNVTIWGLSSGAQYVSTLLVSPAGQGLFHRAVVQSCADLNNVRQLDSSCDVWLGKTAEQWGECVGQELGCASGAGQLAAMRALPAAALVAKTFVAAAHDCYEPAIDRRDPELSVKPWSSLEALHQGRFNKVPVLIGVTDHDGLGKVELEQTLFQDARTREELEALLNREFPEASARVISRFWPSEAAEAKAVHQTLSRLSNDLWYFAGSYYMSQLLAEETPVFSYSFGGLKHSVHGSDAMYWRGSPKGTLPALMSTYLANFAPTAQSGIRDTGRVCILGTFRR